MSGTKKLVPYHQLEWKCSSCGTWNPGDARTCGKCGLVMLTGTAVRLLTTPDEENFFSVTAPGILAELRAIRVLLERERK